MLRRLKCLFNKSDVSFNLPSPKLDACHKLAAAAKLTVLFCRRSCRTFQPGFVMVSEVERIVEPAPCACGNCGSARLHKLGEVKSMRAAALEDH